LRALHARALVFNADPSPQTVQGGINMTQKFTTLAVSAALGLFSTTPVAAAPFFFSTGNPDGLMATATRPASAGKFEIESADDFVLTGPTSTSINSATFTGLIPLDSPLTDIGEVRVEIYRVFPTDSDVTRTSGPSTFSTPNVPTRVNSPSDVELVDRDTASGNLSVTVKQLQTSFSANNSVKPGGIHPMPNVFTGGNGPVTGEEVEFDVTFTTPFLLPADHYFFVPQVELANGDFFWLSAKRPIDSSGTPFPPGFTDLQSWTRDDSNGGIAPDWLRVGTDITHQGPFNATFSLTGEVVPEPASLILICTAFAAMGFARRRKLN
jgi:hypothetical protein